MKTYLSLALTLNADPDIADPQALSSSPTH